MADGLELLWVVLRVCFRGEIFQFRYLCAVQPVNITAWLSIVHFDVVVEVIRPRIVVYLGDHWHWLLLASHIERSNVELAILSQRINFSAGFKIRSSHVLRLLATHDAMSDDFGKFWVELFHNFQRSLLSRIWNRYCVLSEEKPFSHGSLANLLDSLKISIVCVDNCRWDRPRTSRYLDSGSCVVADFNSQLTKTCIILSTVEVLRSGPFVFKVAEDVVITCFNGFKNATDCVIQHNFDTVSLSQGYLDIFGLHWVIEFRRHLLIDESLDMLVALFIGCVIWQKLWILLKNQRSTFLCHRNVTFFLFFGLFRLAFNVLGEQV